MDLNMVKKKKDEKVWERDAVILYFEQKHAVWFNFASSNMNPSNFM
jgi:hypothetical protein